MSGHDYCFTEYHSPQWELLVETKWVTMEVSDQTLPGGQVIQLARMIRYHP